MAATDHHDLIPVSWNGHNINDGSNYVSGFAVASEWGLSTVDTQTVARAGGWPLITGIRRNSEAIVLTIQIIGSDKSALRDQLLYWFDPDDETPKKLVITDRNGSRSRYVYAICEELPPVLIQGIISSVDTFHIVLRVHGSPRWRATSLSTVSSSQTTDGHTFYVANPGSAKAFPIITITPTAAKDIGFAYRQWVNYRWNSDYAGAKYPARVIIDTASLVAAGKMLSSGDDLRVYVDGVEVHRYLSGMNTSTTAVWFSADFQPKQEVALKTAIGTSSTIASIESETDINDFPAEGILIIDNEVFYYKSKSNAERKFLDITRATRNTSIASHSVGATVAWIQHDIYIYYGWDGAPPANYGAYDEQKIAFNLSTSDNETWDYTNFGSRINGRYTPGSWIPSQLNIFGTTGGCYTVSRTSIRNLDFSLIGTWIGGEQSRAVYFSWQLQNPCGIVNARWLSGRVMRTSPITWGAGFHVRYWVRGDAWWSTQYQIPSPASEDVWVNWTVDFAATDWDPADVIAMNQFFVPGQLECDNVTVYLNADDVPTLSSTGEQGNYIMENSYIENRTTGDRIYLNISLDLNQSIEIDTEQKTIKYLGDNSFQFKAISFNSVRLDWLPLVPGVNTLFFYDRYANGVTVDIEFEARYY